MILGVVCARAGSKGVPNKNVRQFLGKPLINIAIGKALASEHIDHVIVSTDHILQSPPPGAAYVGRPKYLAGDDVSKWKVWLYIVGQLEKMEPVDLIVDVDVTRPLTTVEDIDATIELYMDSGAADFTMAVARAKMSPYFDLLEYGMTGALEPSKSVTPAVLNRQDGPPVYRHGGVYVLSKAALVSRDYFWDGVTLGHEIPWWRSLTIDDEWDWIIAENVAKVMKSGARSHEPVR